MVFYNYNMICYETIVDYCCEDVSLIENYDIAVNSPDKYDCHHRFEIQNGKEISVRELKERGLYYKRPANELIFITHNEHTAMHGKFRCVNKGSPANKGKHYFNNGKVEIFANECPEGFKPGRLPRSKKWSDNISKSRLDNPTPITEELRTKLSISHLGHKNSEQCKEKLRISNTGRRFYNNGKINVFVKECPEGFVPGKLIHKI